MTYPSYVSIHFDIFIQNSETIQKEVESFLTYPSYGSVEGALLVVGGFSTFGAVGAVELLDP